MIKEFVDIWMGLPKDIGCELFGDHPKDYLDVVKTVVKVISTGMQEKGLYPVISHTKIHTIDDGSYSGTLLFIIADNEEYSPDGYFYVKIDYGSCSGCDLLEAIQSDGYYDEKPNKQQIKDYMSLCLHIVQGLKKID